MGDLIAQYSTALRSVRRLWDLPGMQLPSNCTHSSRLRRIRASASLAPSIQAKSDVRLRNEILVVVTQSRVIPKSLHPEVSMGSTVCATNVVRRQNPHTWNRLWQTENHRRILFLCSPLLAWYSIAQAGGFPEANVLFYLLSVIVPVMIARSNRNAEVVLNGGQLSKASQLKRRAAFHSFACPGSDHCLPFCGSHVRGPFPQLRDFAVFHCSTLQHV